MLGKELIELKRRRCFGSGFGSGVDSKHEVNLGAGSSTTTKILKRKEGKKKFRPSYGPYQDTQNFNLKVDST